MPQQSWLAHFRPNSNNAMSWWLRLSVSAVSGAVLSLAFTGFYLSFFSWVSLAALFIAVFGAKGRVAFFCGYVHALAFVFTSVPWIGEVLAVHGGLSPAGGYGVLFLIASVWGIGNGGAAWAIARLSQRSVMLACIGAPFYWICLELFRTYLPEISFPWNLLGYPAAGNIALLQLTTLTGIYGLSFVVAGFNALLAWGYWDTRQSWSRRFGAVALVTVILAIVMAAGPRFVPAAQSSHWARGVQLNFPEVEEFPSDWFEQHQKDLAQIQRLSLVPSSHQDDLLVWPETPAPFSYQDIRFARMATDLAVKFEHPFIMGVVEWKPEALAANPSASAHTTLVPFNSSLMIDARGQREFSYDKVHLVPFGEYEPFPLIHRVVSNVSSEVGGFRKGASYSVGKFPNGYPFAVFICYEAIYPGEVRQFAKNGAQVFVNISNDGWFGHSSAAEQHVRMARVRAVENRRWMVRTTNSGITVSVDPYGRIARPLARDVREAADLPYDFRTDQTLFTRFGNWFAWLCLAVSAILLIVYWKPAGTVAP